MEDLRYPVGRFDPRLPLAEADRSTLIDSIADTPARVREAVQGLSEEQLDTPYREGGWTIRQVVHHLPDSHLNAYVRFKLAMTEEAPTIRPYDEARWSELADGRSAPVAVSLDLLDALHARWLLLLRSLSDADFARPLVHPEMGSLTIGTLVRMYEWHGRHHVAHITGLRERSGWPW